MQTVNLRSEYSKAEKDGGLFDLSHWGCVEIVGADAADFLNRMTTLSFKNPTPGEARAGALLTGKGGPIAMGFFETLATDHFFFFSETWKKALEHLEKFHFAEKLELKHRPDWIVMGCYKPNLETDANKPGLVKPLAWGNFSLSAWQDQKIAGLIWMRMKSDQKEPFLKGTGLSLLSRALFNFFRIRAGIPSVGTELGDTHIVLEADFEWLLDRQKGCYPGQEVVERIFTYGQVNQKVFQVLVRNAASKVPLPLFTEGKQAGELIAYTEDPSREDGKGLGLALIRRAFWETPTFSLAPEAAEKGEVEMVRGAARASAN